MVVVAEVAPDLGVADERSGRVRANHGRGDLTGERALLLPMDVLREHTHVRAAHGLGHRDERDRGWRDADGDAGHRSCGDDGAREVPRGVDRWWIHLPVADDEARAHYVRTSARSTSRCST